MTASLSRSLGLVQKSTCHLRQASTLRIDKALINDLPDEMLSYIFYYASHDHHDDDLSAKTFTPLHISHVCHLWRSVALSTGDLWSCLALAYPICQNQLSRLQTWLTRSKSYPVDIFLNCRDENWTWDDEDFHDFTAVEMEKILRIIAPQAMRWRRLHLLTDNWEPIFEFLNYISSVHEAPQLEEISLSRCNAYCAREGSFYPSEMKDPVPFFGGISLPRLRKLSLVGVHVEWSACAQSLSNLEELELKYHPQEVCPSWDEFTAILSRSPTLLRLVILGYGPRLDEGGPQSQYLHKDQRKPQNHRDVKLLHLTHLTFGFLDTESAVELISLFVCPTLKHLVLEDVEGSLFPLDGHLDSTPVLDYLVHRHRMSRCDHDVTATSEDTDNQDSDNEQRHEAAPSDNSPHIPLSRLQFLSLQSIRARLSSFSCLIAECTALERLILRDIEPRPVLSITKDARKRFAVLHETGFEEGGLDDEEQE